MDEESIVKEAQRLKVAAQEAVDAYEQTPNSEDKRKLAKAAKAEAEGYVDLHLPETHPMWVQLQKIHTQYQRVKYGADHYYLMT